MSLASGTKLGPYEVQSLLGAGGMGEVFRARDTRLNRTVAIKVLPEYLGSDPGRRARFDREAQTISRLSHPNICALFDVGEHNGIPYVVLEYLEGETLADRLAKGRLPVSEVLKIGSEIASALDAAHRNGIVHRDIKPANVMLTKVGAKLLDFGLAKPNAVLSSAAADAATLSKSLTEEGVVVGTFTYMAPEQLEGKETDARTDIFALGALLYEMVTGRSAFGGGTRASIIASIMSSDPVPISTLQPLSPLALDRLVQYCLCKNPSERWQTAHDVYLQLQSMRDAGSQASILQSKGHHRITRELIAWAMAAALMVIALTLAVRRFATPVSQPPPEIMFALEPPARYKLLADGGIALSPDASQVAFAASDAKGRNSLWVRSLKSLTPRLLEGSESADDDNWFTWTPGGKSVVAALNKKLVRFPTAGGANEVLCQQFDGLPGTMNREGTILASTAPPTRIFSVSTDDCTARDMSPSDVPESDIKYGFPRFLPDGNHFLFAGIRKDKHHEVLLGSLDNSKTKVLIRNGTYPQFLNSGYILFARDGYLMAQRFDPASQTISGEPFLAYPDQLHFYAAFGWADFDASENGFIAAKEQSTPMTVLRWYDRSGHVLGTLGEPEYRTMSRLDAEGKHVLLGVFDPRTHASDQWSLDLEQGTKKRETFQDHPGNSFAAWTSDNKQIAYSLLLGTRMEIFIKNAASSDNGQMLQTGLEGSKMVSDISSADNILLYQHYTDAGTDFAYYAQPLSGGKPFLIGAAVEDELARVSPDGAWLAVPSNESGSVEIFVRPFAPDSERGTQVSFGGGHDPRWNRDGKELFYRTNDWHIVAVPLLDLKRHRFGKPQTLFQLPQGSDYDVVDGKRFLVNEPSGTVAAPAFVIAHWRPEASKSE